MFIKLFHVVVLKGSLPFIFYTPRAMVVTSILKLLFLLVYDQCISPDEDKMFATNHSMIQQEVKTVPTYSENATIKVYVFAWLLVLLCYSSVQ